MDDRLIDHGVSILSYFDDIFLKAQMRVSTKRCEALV